MTQRVVNFYSEGCRLEGDYRLPADFKPGERRPGIVLCHGFTGIRQLILTDYAGRFTEAGYVTLTFDYRGFLRRQRGTQVATDSVGTDRRYSQCDYLVREPARGRPRSRRIVGH